jgi:hypothetical protein
MWHQADNPRPGQVGGVPMGAVDDSQIRAAHQKLERREQFGKIVLAV